MDARDTLTSKILELMQPLSMFKVRKNISPSPESALITKTKENNRKDESIIGMTNETANRLQRGVPTA